MWAPRPGRGVCVCLGGGGVKDSSGVLSNLRVHNAFARSNWARPWPAVSASTVTRQSYSVNAVVTAAFLISSVLCDPGYTALKHSPCMVQFEHLAFVCLFVFFLVVMWLCPLLFSECWLTIAYMFKKRVYFFSEWVNQSVFPFFWNLFKLISHTSS